MILITFRVQNTFLIKSNKSKEIKVIWNYDRIR